jgi:hypothetical protein
MTPNSADRVCRRYAVQVKFIEQSDLLPVEDGELVHHAFAPVA